MVGVDFIYDFREVSLARRFGNPEGIARRLPGVWVLSFPTYFNGCPFFLNTLNCKSPAGDLLVFMSRNRNSSFVTIWTLSLFVGVGELSSVVHIYAVNFRCWFYAALFTVCWNYYSQSLTSLAILFPINTTRPSSLYIMW